MSRRKALYARKIKRAVHLLFYKRHRKPGVKGWELRKRVGADYPKVISLLNSYLDKLDLEVKTVFEDEPAPRENASPEQLDRARFYVTLKSEVTPKEARMMGWRIDDIAGLAITVAYIISKKGKTPRQDVEKILREKLPGWRVEANIDRYIRAGYIAQDEKAHLYLDWRTRAEIDQRSLINLFLSAENPSP